MGIAGIIIIGLSGLIAQVIILRELLVSFYGNELTVGIILANWVLSEAIGVFFLGRLIDRLKNKINALILLQIIFALLLPVAVYFSRTFKYFLGISSGEAIGLYAIFLTSLIIILPIGFCHGALFSASSRIYASIGRVYAWETIGTLLGGIIYTCLLFTRLNSFWIASSISLLNLILCLFFLKLIPKARFKYLIFAFVILAVCFMLAQGPKRLQQSSIRKQWRGLTVLDYRNSVYGNITVAKEKEQYTFFYNGLPQIILSYPDRQFVEDFGHLPLLFHKDPKQILVIGKGAGGLLFEILKHPVKNIDYAELDPLLIKLLRNYPVALTDAEFKDSRVNIVNMDGRLFLRKTAHKYDCILVGLSSPADLSTNRLFSEEFFALTKKRLNPGGLLAFYLPGSLTYLGQELKDINAVIFNSLKASYAYVRVIPGDYNLFLGSLSADIEKVSAQMLWQRLKQAKIATYILNPAYLEYRLNPRWLTGFAQAMRQANPGINQDLRPIAVFKMLLLWNKQFDLDLVKLYIFVFGGALPVLLYLLYRARRKAPAICYGIFTTGFFGMLANLTLIFAYQVFYGYLYYMLALFISIFMAGIAVGSIVITKNIARIKNKLGLFRQIEGGIIAFSLILAFILYSFSKGQGFLPVAFPALFFLSGLALGLEFPLASQIYLERKMEAGSVSGMLYGADLLGGWFAGLLGSVVLLPILGVFNTCLLIVFLKFTSLFWISRQA